MILVSGFNVYPNEVEDVITAHPKVIECGVIGVPDDHSGEVVKVFVVKRPLLDRRRGACLGKRKPNRLQTPQIY